jgi:hypothetical protein
MASPVTGIYDWFAPEIIHLTRQIDRFTIAIQIVAVSRYFSVDALLKRNYKA